MRELILGGVRSGKSALAEQRAQESALPVTYLATATAGDDEMAARIAHHRQRRPSSWRIVEEPLQLASALQSSARPHQFVIVDCLTLWLTNLLLAEDDSLLERERSALLELLPSLPGQIVLVSNEVGLGIVPLGELSRRFADEAGRLHQQLAACCERVTLVAAGLPLILKGT
ncbi:MAG TPA: bifunctional adenosylcobinamide kinase/adenosylcobinamide-phosphate guanylyltransferase [Gammaproteobacteria bacterium]